MKKQAIIPVIILMGAAMIGILWLQAFWIKNAIDLRSESIRESIFEALNEVSDKLEKDENASLFDGLNGFETLYKESASATISLTNKEDILASIRNKSNRDILRMEQLPQNSLEDRISLIYLKKYIEEAMANRGIDMDFDWAVYSEVKKSYVIKNGHYLVEDTGPTAQSAAYKDLSNSLLNVALFPKDKIADGRLMVHFPELSNLLWKSVLREILISVALVGVILFCFGYVVRVIFRQKKLSEMKTDFINNMTHEFKTPIATISLAADSITSPMILGNEDKVKRFANIIRQENQRMNSQVEKVLQMALLDKDDFELKISNINIHDIIIQAVSHLSLQVEQKDGKITTALNAEKSFIEADVTHLSNIIHNLLDNANKYTPDNPEITVTTNNVPNGVEVIIADNGIGMSKEVRKHIFDKFFREHTGDIHNVKGFGLGLSYVKRIMTAHKGIIDVKSELGVGSKFILFFPFQFNK
ncbi:MAG: HAMP domain-containing histidine kinase [Bacteroidia bacterium]|nr:HAMP domain-containing histidine kinase [Bacteroidia bacterium]